MKGYRRFRFLTTKLTGPHVPNVGQVAFDRLLERKTGCRIAWHTTRRCFVVYRSMGRSRPRTYCDLLKDKHFPLSSSLIPEVRRVIEYTDSKVEFMAGRNHERMLNAMNKRLADESREETRRHIDERFPDVMADMNRTWGIIKSEGQRQPARFFDMKTHNPFVRTPMVLTPG